MPFLQFHTVTLTVTSTMTNRILNNKWVAVLLYSSQLQLNIQKVCQLARHQILF